MKIINTHYATFLMILVAFSVILVSCIHNEISPHLKRIFPITGSSVKETSLPVTPKSNPVPTVDSRILLTSENMNQYWRPSKASCNEHFNQDSPTVFVPYANKTYGIKLSIPYNPHWGSDKYRIQPYDETSRFLAFGPIRGFEACSWERSYFLDFLPPSNREQTIEQIQSTLGLSSLVNTIVIHKLTVLKFIISDTPVGICSWPTMLIIGEKYNYRLSPLCTHDIDGEFRYLENLINNVELID